MKKEELIWRLKEQPTTESLRELVRDKILTNDEARQILFSKRTTEDNERDIKSLEAEIKFLRELIDKLSNRSQIVEIIKEIEVPRYVQLPWYKPYYYWCNGTTDAITVGTSTWNGTTNLCVNNTDSNTQTCSSFSSIQTF
ncbi:MAG: hypothetical protein PHS34_07585 [Candidatus Omnitrophica bacterium]|nr:hypothetical protein [Candidatus Omnitrophota bacterium]MDD5551103.1 hypothetical protein [Candidatus Omnitrophota bacterium]